jgi:hypothetical protein
MYCDGNCQYLDTIKGKCKLDDKRKMAKMKYSNAGLSFTVYEHIGFCRMDGENEEVNE